MKPTGASDFVMSHYDPSQDIEEKKADSRNLFFLAGSGFAFVIESASIGVGRYGSLMTDYSDLGVKITPIDTGLENLADILSSRTQKDELEITITSNQLTGLAAIADLLRKEGKTLDPALQAIVDGKLESYEPTGPAGQNLASVIRDGHLALFGSKYSSSGLKEILAGYDEKSKNAMSNSTRSISGYIDSIKT